MKWNGMVNVLCVPLFLDVRLHSSCLPTLFFFFSVLGKRESVCKFEEESYSGGELKQIYYHWKDV